jgi:hypothetical protein
MLKMVVASVSIMVAASNRVSVFPLGGLVTMWESRYSPSSPMCSRTWASVNWDGSLWPGRLNNRTTDDSPVTVMAA